MRNERLLQAKRAADLAASGGAKSGKKQRKMTDLTEEEMPVSGGGSSLSAPEFETTKKLCFDLLLDKKANNLESKERLGLAEEEARFYERPLELQDTYVKLQERSDAEKKAKKTEVLEKKYQDVLDLNRKEYT
jgi:hypothetical protein